MYPWFAALQFKHGAYLSGELEDIRRNRKIGMADSDINPKSRRKLLRKGSYAKKPIVEDVHGQSRFKLACTFDLGTVKAGKAIRPLSQVPATVSRERESERETQPWEHKQADAPCRLQHHVFSCVEA